MTMMNDSQRRWLARVAQNQFWRVAHWYDLDDLIQDGYMCFYKCVNRYPHAADNPAHIGRLFQISFINHIHNLANHRTRSISEVAFESCTTDATSLDTILTDHYHLPATEALSAAKFSVQEALKLYAREDRRLKAQERVCLGRRHHRETLNDRLCRLIGLDPKKIDVAKEIHTYLAGEVG